MGRGQRMVKKVSGKKTAKPTISRNKPTGTHDNEYFFNGGEMGELMRSFDWSESSLGQPKDWPPELLFSVNSMLNAALPMSIWWDKKQLITFYNDAYRDSLGNKHINFPARPANEVLAEIWDSIKPLINNVFDKAESIYIENMYFKLSRHGVDEDTYFSFSYSPIFNSRGSVQGVLCTVSETTEKVLSRQQLQESEERFKAIADTAPMYIAMADETGNAVYFNKPWLDFTGKPLKEMLGMGWTSTLHPEDATKFEKDFKDAFKKQKTINKEYRFRRADGEYRWMLTIGAPRFTPDGRFIGYFGTYTDFHDLKQTQLALQASEERFRTLIEKSADAVQLVSPEGKIIFTSNSIKNVLGYTPEELQDEGVAPYLHPKDLDYFAQHFRALLKHPGEQVTLQYRVRHKNGSWAWLETVGANHLKTPHINAIVGNFRNITEQKLAEERIRRSEKRFRALADNIPNLAWMAKADGSIYWYNNRWYEYTGTKPEDMEGWGWQSVHDPEVLPDVMKKWKNSIKSGKVFEMVFPLKGVDGEFRPFLTRVVPLRSDSGEIEQWIGTNTDISEQLHIQQAQARNQELEIIAQQLSLQQNELLEINKAKDEFISLASHQLRTPATGVKQYIGMMLSGYAGEMTADQEEFAKHAYESNERQIMIIDDLLKVAQIDAGQMQITKQSTDIVKLIENIINEQADKFTERNQSITFQHDEPTVISEIDSARMRMVIENIVDNAGKYTPDGKKIIISICSDENWINIKVKDQGVGIPKADREKIFEKFVRIDNPLSMFVGGSGLGLYLAEKIIKLHEGSIDLTSKIGKGTIFTIKLPKRNVKNKKSKSAR